MFFISGQSAQVAQSASIRGQLRGTLIWNRSYPRDPDAPQQCSQPSLTTNVYGLAMLSITLCTLPQHQQNSFIDKITL